ncbi:MAG: ANTAR domain-containing protein [Acidimicrobiia bacterium]|nr:ANTAR domain-containing protein [Acidimicrobiia bacterium]
MAQSTEVPGVDRPNVVADLALEIEHLRRALVSRDVIGQAKGILMERFKVTADEAFRLLVAASQHQNIRVAELSANLAGTGEWSGPVPEH